MHELPFQVGQLVESRSFQVGFRGAWFRCKIRGIRKKNGKVQHLMEYIDYPDQKVAWTKLYQKPTYYKNKSKSIKKQLMVRPCFPTIYHESERPDVSTISESIVIVGNAWKVGDLVDWWADGCYWCGRVTEILENGKVKIDLPSLPMGEGLTYEAFSKDIRPSLDWCPENGWTVPIPMLPPEVGDQHPCAQLIKPENSESVVNINASDGLTKEVQPSISTSLGCNSSYSSQNTEGLLDSLEGSIAMSNTTTDGMELDAVETSIRIASSSNSVSSSQVRAMATENVRATAINDDGYVEKYPSKKMRTDKKIYVNSMFFNSIEAAILDLEELVNRVKWMRGILEFGMPMSATNKPLWEFLQHDA